MAYNKASVWYHLYVPYVLQIEEQKHVDLSIMEAFAKSTDGPDCPVSRCYSELEHRNFVEPLGFKQENFGVAVSCWEMVQLPKRFWAIMDRNVAQEHRQFLAALTFDKRGLPMAGDHYAGIDGCYTYRAV